MLQEICFQFPEHALGHAYLGKAWLQLGHVDVARLELERAVDLAPDSVTCRVKYAEFLLSQGAPEQALGEVDHALRLPAHDKQARSRILRLRGECVRQSRTNRWMTTYHSRLDPESSSQG